MPAQLAATEKGAATGDSVPKQHLFPLGRKQDMLPGKTKPRGEPSA